VQIDVHRVGIFRSKAVAEFPVRLWGSRPRANFPEPDTDERHIDIGDGRFAQDVDFEIPKRTFVDMVGRPGGQMSNRGGMKRLRRDDFRLFCPGGCQAASMHACPPEAA
jgi:hypothetical protein